MVEASRHHQAILWTPNECSMIQFQHYLPRGSIGSQRLRVQSYKTALHPTSEPVAGLSNPTGYKSAPMSSSLGLINLLEWLTEKHLLTRFNFYNPEQRDKKMHKANYVGRVRSFHTFSRCAIFHTSPNSPNLTASKPCPFGFLGRLHYIGMIY